MPVFVHIIFSFLSGQRLFFPVLKPCVWEEAVQTRINSGEAENVIVTSHQYPHVNEAVLFREDFVTMSQVTQMIQNSRLEMKELALIHCRGMRKIAQLQAVNLECEICFEENITGYNCINCLKCVCIRCFPMVFHDRVIEHAAESTIEYKCPYCNITFATFPQISMLEEEEVAEQVPSSTA